MPYTPEQIAALKATDPTIVRQTLERMSDADRSELLQILKGGTPAVEVTPEMMASHKPNAGMLPSHTPGAPLPASIPPLPVPGAPEPPAQPETTAAGLAGAITRGAGPYAASLAVGPEGPALVAGAKLLDPLAEGLNSLKHAVGLDPYIADQLTPSQFMGYLMDKMGVAKPRTAVERVAQAGAEAGAGGLGIASLGQQMTKSSAPLVKGVGEVLAAAPAQQAAGGAGAGVASQTTAELGGGPTAQIAAGLAGGMLGANAAQPRSALGEAYKLPEIQAAKEAGIPVMTTDVLPPQTFASKFLQSAGEKIPWVGTGGARRAQQVQRIEAVKDLMREFGVTDVGTASDEVMKDLLSKRSADISKYTGLKSGVIQKLDPVGVVPVDRTVAAIDNQINKLASLKTNEVTPVIDRLNDWKNALQDQSLGNIEALRAQIGESFKAPEMAASRTIGEKALTSIYGPLREDMGDFIKANGAPSDYTKWKVANTRLANSMGELDKDVLASVLKKGESTPEEVQKMIFSKKPSDVKALMSNLTANGKANAKMAILAKALEDSGGIENLSPEKFITATRKLGAPIGVAFDGQDAQRMNGLVRALQLTEHASKASLVPPTGVQAVPFLAADVLSKTLGGPLGATAGAAGIGGLARAYESPVVRNILLRLPKTIPGSAEEAALFKRLAVIQPKDQPQENQQ